MTEDKFEQHLNSARKIALSTKDKESVSNALKVYMASHPVDDDVRGFGNAIEVLKQALAIRFKF